MGAGRSTSKPQNTADDAGPLDVVALHLSSAVNSLEPFAFMGTYSGSYYRLYMLLGISLAIGHDLTKTNSYN